MKVGLGNSYEIDEQNFVKNVENIENISSKFLHAIGKKKCNNLIMQITNVKIIIQM